MDPEVSPGAVRWKQQPLARETTALLRATKALMPSAKEATRAMIAVFIMSLNTEKMKGAAATGHRISR
jgi:hypothetical protein